MLRMLSVSTPMMAALAMNAGAQADVARAKGDIEYGEYLSSECVTCHQATGSDKGIPPIVGWHVDSFISVLEAYRSKDLTNPVMQTIAGRLDDEQIASLALYFGSLPAKPEGGD